MSDGSAYLVVQPSTGMAGDMFASALVGLGVPARDIAMTMESAAQDIGGATVTIHHVSSGSDGEGYRITSSQPPGRPPLTMDDALRSLTRTLDQAEVAPSYAQFAIRALHILSRAEHRAHETITQGEAHHHHAGANHAVLHEAQDIVMDLAAAAWGLHHLSISLERIACVRPVFVGGGRIRFSHGEFSAPAPATREILSHHGIPWSYGPFAFEQLTPTGAAILAALRPQYIEGYPSTPVFRLGRGFGARQTTPPNALVLLLVSSPPARPVNGTAPDSGGGCHA